MAASGKIIPPVGPFLTRFPSYAFASTPRAVRLYTTISTTLTVEPGAVATHYDFVQNNGCGRGKRQLMLMGHRDDGKRLVVRSEEKLTAFFELEKVTGESLQNAI
jgi:hypothetical protein